VKVIDEIKKNTEKWVNELKGEIVK